MILLRLLLLACFLKISKSANSTVPGSSSATSSDTSIEVSSSSLAPSNVESTVGSSSSSSSVFASSSLASASSSTDGTSVSSESSSGLIETTDPAVSPTQASDRDRDSDNDNVSDSSSSSSISSSSSSISSSSSSSISDNDNIVITSAENPRSTNSDETSPSSTDPSSSSLIPESTSPPGDSSSTDDFQPSSAISTDVVQTTVAATPTTLTSTGSVSSQQHMTAVLSTIISVVDGNTVFSTTYITSPVSATSETDGGSSHTTGLSTKNKNIVIGCIVGIGLPIILVVSLIFLRTCVKSERTDFINSEGKVITAYSTSRLSTLWNSLLGKKVNKYESDSPLGGSPVHDVDVLEKSHIKRVSNRNTSLSFGALSLQNNRRSQDPVISEERYYDDDGNELTAKNY
ncbi:Mid2p Ecym_6111 [Eremothecium cymbalariae DBVPG|uniref:Mid2 domain-containing protein n=1 Tax=Eremothecium cymbalariae (strain CBS 270.75 / DBVPG 7215 / KCTC 17166 / NRRL Y-17582) TaxID=931890 RepID=G8JV26_ERECY|nr:hypothetical protein Ecym_6111 [Eremothecium cymbalariae DBVPG\